MLQAIKTIEEPLEAKEIKLKEEIIEVENEGDRLEKLAEETRKNFNKKMGYEAIPEINDKDYDNNWTITGSYKIKDVT